MKLSIDGAAKLEWFEAVDYFDQIDQLRIGLAIEFDAALTAAVHEISAQPLSWPKYLAGTRIRLVPKYHYGVVYKVYPTLLRIVAVADLRRRRGYWKPRLQRKPVP